MAEVRRTPQAETDLAEILEYFHQHNPSVAEHYATPLGSPLGRVDLGGCPPRSPTDPGVHVKCTRFVTLWNRCPSHDWVVSR